MNDTDEFGPNNGRVLLKAELRPLHKAGGDVCFATRWGDLELGVKEAWPPTRDRAPYGLYVRQRFALHHSASASDDGDDRDGPRQRRSLDTLRRNPLVQMPPSIRLADLRPSRWEWGELLLTGALGPWEVLFYAERVHGARVARSAGSPGTLWVCWPRGVRPSADVDPSDGSFQDDLPF